MGVSESAFPLGRRSPRAGGRNPWPRPVLGGPSVPNSPSKSLSALERLTEESRQGGPQSAIDVVLLDLSLPDSEGLETLAKTHTSAPEVPIIVLTGLGDEALGFEAVRRGAQDYLIKGEVTTALLSRAIRYAVERNRLLDQLEEARERKRRDEEIRRPLSGRQGSMTELYE